MLRLPPPSVDSATTYSASVAAVRDLTRRTVFEGASSTVLTRCRAYDRLAASSSFEQAAGPAFRVPELADHDMADLYDSQFVRGRRTRGIREELQNAAPNGLCPYCGQGSVHELDHYLPKSTFAGTTVHPANLVPACRDCNREKRSYAPGVARPAVLHPYFDSAIESRWLYAHVGSADSCSPVVTFVVCSTTNDFDIEGRLRAHMDVFNLHTRFGQWAAQALENFEALLTSPLGASMTLDAAKSHLAFSAVQQSGGRANSWERATYEAMSASDWYLRTHLGLT